MALCYPSLAALPLLTLLVTAAGAATGEGFLAAPLPINSSQPPFGSSAPARTVAAAAPSDGSGLSVVDLYGQLAVEGNAIVSNETGLPVRLRGVSLFWSQWIPKYWNAEALQWLRDDWHVAVIRAAMGIEGGGYLVNPEAEKGRVKAVVQAAIDLGIYVIIDWHDHNAESHLEEATEFFDEMAQRYGGYPNVLFEVFNEPMLQRWEDAIKPYHESLVAVIRQHTDNLIILGTRFWSQAVHGASLSPVIGENLAYTIHFYAATHRETIRDQVAQALANGVAVFATEWGTCEATGDGTLDFEEAWQESTSLVGRFEHGFPASPCKRAGPDLAGLLRAAWHIGRQLGHWRQGGGLRRPARGREPCGELEPLRPHGLGRLRARVVARRGAATRGHRGGVPAAPAGGGLLGEWRGLQGNWLLQRPQPHVLREEPLVGRLPAGVLARRGSERAAAAPDPLDLQGAGRRCAEHRGLRRLHASLKEVLMSQLVDLPWFVDDLIS